MLPQMIVLSAQEIDSVDIEDHRKIYSSIFAIKSTCIHYIK